MIFDKILFDKLYTFSKNLCHDYKIKEPKDRNSLVKYLKILQQGIDLGEINSQFIGLTLYNFVTSKETRDRHTTARIFEDIFGKLVGVVTTDTEKRENPPVPEYIKEYDYYSKNTNWSISIDLSGNKREKADHKIDNYNLSIKTLKGQLYDINGKIIDRDFNNEINIGSLSHRALFLGITDRALSDRRGGLGSPRQIIPLLKEIEENGHFNEFKKRIKDYISYVYQDDMVIVFKSGYKMRIVFIPYNTFVEAIIKSLDEKNPIESFTKIWYRWENNNLRIRFSSLMDMIKKLKLDYDDITLNLENIIKNEEFMNNIKFLEDLLNKKIEDFLK